MQKIFGIHWSKTEQVPQNIAVDKTQHDMSCLLEQFQRQNQNQQQPFVAGSASILLRLATTPRFCVPPWTVMHLSSLFWGYWAGNTEVTSTCCGGTGVREITETCLLPTGSHTWSMWGKCNMKSACFSVDPYRSPPSSCFFPSLNVQALK